MEEQVPTVAPLPPEASNADFYDAYVRERDLNDAAWGILLLRINDMPQAREWIGQYEAAKRARPI